MKQTEIELLVEFSRDYLRGPTPTLPLSNRRAKVMEERKGILLDFYRAKTPKAKAKAINEMWGNSAHKEHVCGAVQGIRPKGMDKPTWNMLLRQINAIDVFSKRLKQC